MVDTESLLEQFMLSGHHVVVIVVRKVRVQSIAGLARLSMTDVVGQNDKVSARVQQLPWTKQNARKLWLEKLTS